MTLFKCKMCGGTLEINNNESVAKCEYCGTQQTIPTTIDDVTTNLYNRANNLRLKCEFDKAAQIYEKIVENNDSEAEAHWGIVLCKYGIEYVEEPQTMQRIPTCHRTLFDTITKDVDYLAAIDYADSLQQAIYEKEARAIDKIQKEILTIVNNENPFDVFICYKETDENGKRTIDSTIANDIYYQLTEEGFKVFYAAITLEDKLGQEYEPYIFAALNSAKVMLVLGTKQEYFNAIWVKNEWSRFLNFMKTDRSKLIIPCYRDMDAYDLPEEFAHLQSQDMGKIGFINDVVRGIKKVTQTEKLKATVVKETDISNENTNTAPLLKRAFMFLEDGEWQSANEYCEKVLDIDPENAQAYLGKLLSELQVRRQESLADCSEPFHGSNNYKKVVRFADEKLQAILSGYIEHINTRNENQRLEKIYNQAKKIMTAAHRETGYKEAAQLFESIRGYKDSNRLIQKCYENAEIARKDTILANGKSLMSGQTISNYKRAITLFESISGWKDSDEEANVCKQKVEEITAKEETERFERERKAEIEQKEAERVAKRNKKVKIIAMSTVCIIVVFIIVLNNVIIPKHKYNKAISLMTVEKYDDAISFFETLNGYKDSEEKINECNDLNLDKKYKDALELIKAGDVINAYETLNTLERYKDSVEIADSIFAEYKVEKLKAAKVGECIFWGTYEQDNNTSNGTEDIEWCVLEIVDGKVLLISKYALERKQYYSSWVDVTWETSVLREWLNGEFLGLAFSSEEKDKLSRVIVSADRGVEYSTDAGNETVDYVFLLSSMEAEQYFNSDTERICQLTEYAFTNSSSDIDSRDISWWLRTPGRTQRHVTTVERDGEICEFGDEVHNDRIGVRPAIWIDLSL